MNHYIHGGGARVVHVEECGVELDVMGSACLDGGPGCLVDGRVRGDVAEMGTWGQGDA